MPLHAEYLGEEAHPAVVLLHGFMGRGADFRETAGFLSRTYRCVMPDLPGHGASPGLAEYCYETCAQAVLQMLAQAGLTRCALAGYSMGGRLALYCALRDPARFSALAMISSTPGLDGGPERQARAERDAAMAARLRGGALETFLDAWYEQPLFQSLRDRPALLARVKAGRAQMAREVAAQMLEQMSPGRQPSLWARLPDLRMPVLVCAGGRDAHYAALAPRVAGLCPRGRHVIFASSGHAVYAEAPEELAESLRDFLKDTA